VAEGTEVKRGTAVNIVVAVTLTGPGLTSPGNGASFAKGTPFPTLTWQPVPGAAYYLVRVDTEVCELVLVYPSFEIDCKYRIGTVPGGFHTTSATMVKTTSVTPQIVLKPREGAFLHSGKVRWQVTPFDDLDGDGPPSGYFTFQVTVQ